MAIRFESRDLWALCNGGDALTRRWGSERAEAVKQRLHELDAAVSLDELDSLPFVRVCAGSDGCVVVSVCSGLGLLVRPLADSRTGRTVGDRAVTDFTLVGFVEDRAHQE